MKIIIAGASGFIGKYLIPLLLKDKHQIIALSRRPQNQLNQPGVVWKKWANGNESDWIADLEGSDAIINLTGEGIANGKWTEKRKQALLTSRTEPIQLLINGIKQCKNRPRQFLQVSAIGIYKPGQQGDLDELAETGSGFLEQLTAKWEEASSALAVLGVKRYIMRIGLIIAPDSLLIKKMKLPHYFFSGGYIGNGQQRMSWIHINDVVGAMGYLLKNGPKPEFYNFTAPHPVSMQAFSKALGASMGRPSWLHVPSFIVKFVFGQMAEETMLSPGGNYLPVNLLKSGYQFKHSTLEQAL